MNIETDCAHEALKSVSVYTPRGSRRAVLRHKIEQVRTAFTQGYLTDDESLEISLRLAAGKSWGALPLEAQDALRGAIGAGALPKEMAADCGLYLFDITSSKKRLSRRATSVARNAGQGTV